MKNQSITVEISEEECQRLMDGEEFCWSFPARVEETGEMIEVEVVVKLENQQ